MTSISSTRFSRPAAGLVARQIAVTGLLITLLCSCATTKKVAEADETGEAEAGEIAATLPAKGGTTAQGTYVDPMVTTAHGRKLAQNGMLAPGMRGATGGKLVQNALTQTYSSAQPSLADVVTEPTGVRAGSVSIFSGHNSAPAAEAPTALTALDSPYPAASAMPAGGVNATARSVFSTGAPVACGNDANGNMISC